MHLPPFLGKLYYMKRLLIFLLTFTTISGAVKVMALGSGALPEKVIFSAASSYNEATSNEAAAAWGKVAALELGGKPPQELVSGLILLHHYTVGRINPATSEWVVIMHTRVPNGPRLTLVRLDWKSLEVKDRRDIPYPDAAPADAAAAAARINQHPIYPPHTWQVRPEQVEAVGDYYLFFQPATDFGGTAVVHKPSGQLVFSASTITMGSGRLVYPPGPSAGDPRPRTRPPGPGR